MATKCCKTCGKKVSHGSLTGLCQVCYRSRGPELAGHDGMRLTGDRAELVRTTDQHVRTLADLIRVCEIDTNEWSVDSFTCNKWEAAAKDDTGRMVSRPLFQVKAIMKRKVAVLAARLEIDALKAEAKKAIKPRPAPKRARPQGEHLLEISIPDLHVGKLAWSEETLGANYDHKIALDLYRAALDALIARTAAFRFSQIVLPVGNDFYHADTKSGMTTAGTPLDTDSRWHKTFVAGRRLMVEAVERLRAIAPVTVVVVPGNHDAHATFCLGDSLECWYHSTPDVAVWNQPSQRKYMQHGKVMLLWTHKPAKGDSLPLLMATERPEMFGSTVHREAHVGHLHQLRVSESMGVRVRVSPALCPADAWHSENLFVLNKRAAEAFVWHPEDGLVSMAVYTVPEE